MLGAVLTAALGATSLGSRVLALAAAQQELDRDSGAGIVMALSPQPECTFTVCRLRLHLPAL